MTAAIFPMNAVSTGFQNDPTSACMYALSSTNRGKELEFSAYASEQPLSKRGTTINSKGRSYMAMKRSIADAEIEYRRPEGKNAAIGGRVSFGWAQPQPNIFFVYFLYRL